MIRQWLQKIDQIEINKTKIIKKMQLLTWLKTVPEKEFFLAMINI